MSEYSVKNISKLPMLFPDRQGGLARSLMLKVLAKLQVGSLTIKEEGETLVFGSKSDPSAPHAEVHVHDSDLYHWSAPSFQRYWFARFGLALMRGRTKVAMAPSTAATATGSSPLACLYTTLRWHALPNSALRKAGEPTQRRRPLCSIATRSPRP